MSVERDLALHEPAQQPDPHREALVMIANHCEDKWARGVARRAIADAAALNRTQTPEEA